MITLNVTKYIKETNGGRPYWHYDIVLSCEDCGEEFIGMYNQMGTLDYGCLLEATLHTDTCRGKKV
jgi:hypothetical protein